VKAMAKNTEKIVPTPRAHASCTRGALVIQLVKEFQRISVNALAEILKMVTVLVVQAHENVPEHA